MIDIYFDGGLLHPGDPHRWGSLCNRINDVFADSWYFGFDCIWFWWCVTVQRRKYGNP